MSSTVSADIVPNEYDPFNPVPEPEQDKEALIRSLTLARKWGLYFVVCNSSEERARLMDEVTTRFPGKNIQHLPVAHEVGNLVDVLREKVKSPPDILFVYGLERWLSGAVNPRSVPFLLNLNAARDLFPEFIPGPMVLWLPQFALEAIANAAPDFFSVRSGIYSFPVERAERTRMIDTAHQLHQLKVFDLPQAEREDQILQMQSLLSEMRSLPCRDLLEEAKILNRMGLLLQALGNVDTAEDLYNESLQIKRCYLPKNDEEILISLNNIISARISKGDYVSAQCMSHDVLTLLRENTPVDYGTLTLVLHNLANSTDGLGQTKQALSIMREAMSSTAHIQGDNRMYVSYVTNGMAALYSKLDNYTKALEYALRSLFVAEELFDASHPSIAVRKVSLAIIYAETGRAAEAEPLLREAITAVRTVLGVEHPLRRHVEKAFDDYTKAKRLAVYIKSASGSRVTPSDRPGETINRRLRPMQRSSKNKHRK